MPKPHILQSLKNILSSLYASCIASTKLRLCELEVLVAHYLGIHRKFGGFLLLISTFTLYTHHHICTLYCASHTIIYTLISMLEHYSLCPTTPNNHLWGINKMFAYKKDRLYEASSITILGKSGVILQAHLCWGNHEKP